MQEQTNSRKTIFDNFTQYALPTLTIGGQIATSLKFPEWGLIICLLSQPFWLYSSWKAYKQAGQIGILITSSIFSVVTMMGIVNYWLL